MPDPFVPVDFPNPQAKRPPAALYTLVNTRTLLLFSPFFNYDFPNPLNSKSYLNNIYGAPRLGTSIFTLVPQQETFPGSGRIFTLDIEAGTLQPLGSAFPAGHLPYALTWHMNRLWCGTNTHYPYRPGRIYFIRPGIDAGWTLDYDLLPTFLGGVSSLLSFKGLLYVGTVAQSGTSAQILVRGVDGNYTTSDTGLGGTPQDNNGYLTLAEFNGKLYASYWNADTPAISKIRVFDGTTWSTSYTGSGATNIPIIAFPIDQDTLLAFGGGPGYQASLIGTTDGTTWDDRTAFLTQSSPVSTGVPAFGVVVR